MDIIDVENGENNAKNYNNSRSWKKDSIDAWQLSDGIHTYGTSCRAEKRLLPPWKWTLPEYTQPKEVFIMAVCCLFIAFDVVFLAVMLTVYDAEKVWGTTMFWTCICTLVMMFGLGVFIWCENENDIKQAFIEFKDHNSTTVPYDDNPV